MKVLVTGATGKQGGATARALLARGHQVHAMTRDRDSGTARALESAGAEIVAGNFLKRDSLIAAMQGGKYVVTGDREVTAVLTIHPTDRNGIRRWELDNGATLYDVTHLPCRSARYTPMRSNSSCSTVITVRTLP